MRVGGHRGETRFTELERDVEYLREALRREDGGTIDIKDFSNRAQIKDLCEEVLMGIERLKILEYIEDILYPEWLKKSQRYEM